MFARPALTGDVKVEIWSDVVCPWCYIGKRRFEDALARFEHRDEVEVVWRSFELDPSAPRDGSSLDLTAHLARKYGVSLEQAEAMHARVTQVAADEGLEYRLDLARRGSSFDAHRLVHAAAGAGLQDAMKERLLRAYFTEGVLLSDHDELRRLAAEVGVDASFLDDPTEPYADAVRADVEEARALEVSGVPFFAVDRRFGIAGAQDADTVLLVLQRAWAARDAA